MCLNPIYAIITNLGDKNHLRILPHRPDYSIDYLTSLYGSSLIALGCGHCVDCQLDYRKHWAMRCEFESKLHQNNCFLTLTYNDLCYPGQLVKSDIQLFIKALRNRGIVFRYFGCCERGEEFGRYHFHMIIFGWLPDDLKYWSKSKSGHYIYRSKFIEDVWSKGFVYVEDVESSVGSYVAGYTSKKLGGYDSYLFMSRRPGIGFGYIVNNLDYLFKNGYVSKNGRIFSLDRYILKVAGSLGYDFKSYLDSKIKLGLNLQYSKIRNSGYSSIDEFLLNQKRYFKHYRRSF